MLLARYAGWRLTGPRCRRPSGWPARRNARGADLVLAILSAMSARGRRVATVVAAWLEHRLHPPQAASRAPLPEMRRRARDRSSRTMAAGPPRSADRPGPLLASPGAQALPHELASTDTVSVAGNAALLGRPGHGSTRCSMGSLQPTLAGVELRPPIYLRDLLTLCNLLDRHAQPPAPGASRHGRRPIVAVRRSFSRRPAWRRSASSRPRWLPKW